MNNELKNITFYDLLAALCYKIGKVDKEEKKRIYRAYYQNYVEIEKKAEDVLGLHLIADIRDVFNSDLDDTRACEFLKQMNHSEDGDLLAMAGISLIDKYLGTNGLPRAFLKDCPIVDDTGAVIGVSQHFKKFDALNPKTAETWGTILPLVECFWEKTSVRNMETVSEDPLSLLRHHIWLPSCSSYTLHNLIYKDGLPRKETLNILASPITNVAPFRITLFEDRANFKIEYDEMYSQRVVDIFKNEVSHAIDTDIDIAIFPEMLGSEECVRITSKFYQENWNARIPVLTLLPTREYCIDTTNKTYVNELAVLDEDGNAIICYHKQHPFEYDKITVAECDKLSKRFFEPIVADHELFIIHIPGAGRIGIMICSDIFDSNLREYLIKQNKLTLLLHPSFSGGLDLLERAYSTADENSCDVVLCNTCAAFLPEGEIEKPITSRETLEQVDANVCRYFAYGHKSRKSFSASTKCVSSKCSGCYTLFKIPFGYKKTVYWEHINCKEQKEK